MLTNPVIQTFISRARKRSYPPKHTIIRAGDTPTSLYLLLEGSVCIQLEEPGGREFVLAYLEPGHFFGEMCLFPDQEFRSAVVRTRKQPTLVAEIDYPSFRQFAAEHHEIMYEIAGQLAARLRNTSQRLGDLAFLDVAGRMAHILLDLSHKPDAIVQDNGRVVRVSRQELARNAGCSREMAGRVLKKLEEDGLVLCQGRNVVLLNTPA